MGNDETMISAKSMLTSAVQPTAILFWLYDLFVGKLLYLIMYLLGKARDLQVLIVMMRPGSWMFGVSQHPMV